jgi:hypothetical protein
LLCSMLQVDSYAHKKQKTLQPKSSIHLIDITMERVLFLKKQHPFHCNVERMDWWFGLLRGFLYLCVAISLKHWTKQFVKIP